MMKVWQFWEDNEDGRPKSGNFCIFPYSVRSSSATPRSKIKRKRWTPRPEVTCAHKTKTQHARNKVNINESTYVNTKAGMFV